jgi:hypothetical protein
MCPLDTYTRIDWPFQVDTESQSKPVGVVRARWRNNFIYRVHTQYCVEKNGSIHEHIGSRRINSIYD